MPLTMMVVVMMVVVLMDGGWIFDLCGSWDK
jgi:hypothetical protein